MAVILDCLIEILKKPEIGDVFSELTIFFAPLWIALSIGLFVGWYWRPNWALEFVGTTQNSLNLDSISSSNGEMKRGILVNLQQLPGPSKKENEIVVCSSVETSKELAVLESDLVHLMRLVEERDGGPTWHKMMDKTLPTFRYQAWRRDPETGPPQYRSSTIFEDADPETVRDFFWDDEFRTKNGWDDMLLQHETLEECPVTGTMIVKWVRKFPFFCSDREYIIGRRIWDSGRAYYCVTKGVPNNVPRRNKPRRVDSYNSSWCIRPVESRRGDGQMSACEVLLFHQEDMGIPWEIAKLGIRQGMWGCVKRIDPSLRAYQSVRVRVSDTDAKEQEQPYSSRPAELARVNTRFNPSELILKEEQEGERGESESDDSEGDREKGVARKPGHWVSNVPKVLVIGGAVALACTFDHGLVTKAVIFGVARRFARIGKRL